MQIGHMTHLLPRWPLFVAFLVTSVVLAVTPGPGVLYIVATSVSQGRRLGSASVAGVAFGNLSNALGASIGLAALFAVSPLALNVVKYAGAAYLIYLGSKAFTTATPAAQDASAAQPRAPRRAFGDGFLVALLNPKTALFFAAFLPQFMDPLAPRLLRTAMLSVIFVVIAASTDSLYAIRAGSLRPWLTQRSSVRAVGQYITGGVYIALGFLAVYFNPAVHHRYR